VVWPVSHTYLKPFVEELNHLGTHGMQYVNVDNDVVTCKVYSVCCSSDSCARPLLRETMQFNGRYGCDWCLTEAESIKHGDGISHIYVPSHDELKLRDNGSFVNDALHASLDNPINGVKGVSPLLFLPLFAIVLGFVPDYLHCVLLGIVRTFASLWFHKSNHAKPWYIGQPGYLLLVDNFLLCDLLVIFHVCLEAYLNVNFGRARSGNLSCCIIHYWYFMVNFLRST